MCGNMLKIWTKTNFFRQIWWESCEASSSLFFMEGRLTKSAARTEVITVLQGKRSSKVLQDKSHTYCRSHQKVTKHCSKKNEIFKCRRTKLIMSVAGKKIAISVAGQNVTQSVAEQNVTQSVAGQTITKSVGQVITTNYCRTKDH